MICHQKRCVPQGTYFSGLICHLQTVCLSSIFQLVGIVHWSGHHLPSTRYVSGEACLCFLCMCLCSLYAQYFCRSRVWSPDLIAWLFCRYRVWSSDNIFSRSRVQTPDLAAQSFSRSQVWFMGPTACFRPIVSLAYFTFSYCFINKIRQN